MLFRVPKTQVLDRKHYEFFAERQGDDGAKWDKDIGRSAAVHRFPRGWRCGNIVYNAPLAQYMMVASYGKSKRVDMETRVSEPTILSFWVARQPWGPWHKVYEETPWQPGGGGNAIGDPKICPKWISDDGRSLWMSWTDTNYTSKFHYEIYPKVWHAKSRPDHVRLVREFFGPHGNLRFNRQRVDLIVG